MAILAVAMSLEVAVVDPPQGTSITAMKALALIAATSPSQTPILKGLVIPPQSSDRETAVKKQLIHRTTVIQNVMNLETQGTANASLIRRSLSILGLPRSSSPTRRMFFFFFFFFFFIYSHIVHYSRTSDVYKLHNRSRGILRYLGPFIHMWSTFTEGSRLASAAVTSPDTSR